MVPVLFCPLIALKFTKLCSFVVVFPSVYLARIKMAVEPTLIPGADYLARQEGLSNETNFDQQ